MNRHLTSDFFKTNLLHIEARTLDFKVHYIVFIYCLAIYHDSYFVVYWSLSCPQAL